MEELELTILMPCLNEAETLAGCIQKAKTFLENEKIAGEVLIADNGSIDGSQKIALDKGARVIDVAQRGYGAALIDGIQHARGRYVIMGDADGSYDFLNLNLFLNKLREGYDLVMGNRFRGGIAEGAMPFLNKYLGNPVLSLIGRVFYSSSIGDFHCGLRGFNSHAMRQLKLEANGMEFASEMVVKATLQQLRLTEVPTTLSPDGRSRRPHLRPWRDGWRHLRLLLLYSPKWLFLYPGISLLVLGIGLMSLLITGPLQIGKYNLDIHTLLFSSVFIIVGLQAVFFFFFSRVITRPKKKPFPLEKWLLLGVTLTLLGCGGSGYSFFLWMQNAFGPLIPEKMMRILIPSFTFLLTGMQIIFASFFVGLLKLNSKHAQFN